MICIRLISISLCIIFVSGCTISFQNIDTHGAATDLVDENQTSSPNVAPNLNIPLK